jgi:ribosomal protein S18 acetylase RimI-like enzyme
MNEINIRVLEADNLPQVACIHQNAFPKSALGKLGKEAVRRYYEWQLIGPHDAVAKGIFQNGSLTGFCFAGIFHGALAGFIRKNRSYLAWRVLSHPWLINSPLIRDRLHTAWKALTHRSKIIPISCEPAKSFGVLSIAVDPVCQGRGYGKELMMVMEKIALERRFENMHLTVAIDNYQAIDFYEKIGWLKVPGNDGSWHGAMVKKINDQSK